VFNKAVGPSKINEKLTYLPSELQQSITREISQLHNGLLYLKDVQVEWV
jgi:hypothetical protein